MSCRFNGIADSSKPTDSVQSRVAHLRGNNLQHDRHHFGRCWSRGNQLFAVASSRCDEDKVRASISLGRLMRRGVVDDVRRSPPRRGPASAVRYRSLPDAKAAPDTFDHQENRVRSRDRLRDSTSPLKEVRYVKDHAPRVTNARLATLPRYVSGRNARSFSAVAFSPERRREAMPGTFGCRRALRCSLRVFRQRPRSSFTGWSVCRGFGSQRRSSGELDSRVNLREVIVGE